MSAYGIIPFKPVKAGAVAGRLPCLKVGRQLRFNFHAGRSMYRFEGSVLKPRPAAVGAVSDPLARARGPPGVHWSESPAGRLETFNRPAPGALCWKAKVPPKITPPGPSGKSGGEQTDDFQS
jgi:hypothetical protein